MSIRGTEVCLEKLQEWVAGSDLSDYKDYISVVGKTSGHCMTNT